MGHGKAAMSRQPTSADPDGYKRRLDEAVDNHFLVEAARAVLVCADKLDDAHKIQKLMNSGAFSLIEATRALDIINEEKGRCPI